MKTYKIAAVYGDGIGHEIVPVGLKVLHALGQKHGFALEADTF